MDSLLAAGLPDFVIVSVPWEVAPVVTAELVAEGIPVLTETPPAPDVEGLRRLWSSVGDSGLVQVAEQNPFLPSRAAQLSVIQGGALGQVSSVQLSSTHLYHAVAVIRLLLGVGMAPVRVEAREFVAPLVDPMTRDGWTGDGSVRDAVTTLATLDFGGLVGLYDFTDNQWHNPLRGSRIVIRGSHGELVDDRLVRLVDPSTAVESRLVRRQTGLGANLEGFALDHLSLDGEVVYRNPFPGVRLADEDIAIGSLLARMIEWCRGEGEPPYPLAAASQDHLIALAISESVASGAAVKTTSEAWSEGV
ncbi:gfo/Idh/MocA family oxidoreductase [Streptomyces sp. SID13031]|uniref:gfo/Idh/MocA family oxidoreductase n=1 Tax=Streptomyces sp. SID13031 TaxID=2706046 RepID=UPI0013CC455F|nr:gfo/Idh/MocA family oxidoreductase [Streptomyces sp. SID13031]NEA35450.1 gfo/Idh/MocA family oxidoreductase [Streptomyces sp. SID13031]